MMRLPSPRNGKVAGNLGQNAATLLGDTDKTSSIGTRDDSPASVTSATGQAAMLRVLLARLDKLGLSHSTQDDSILIAGQAYDLRSAAAMARQLGRASA